MKATKLLIGLMGILVLGIADRAYPGVRTIDGTGEGFWEKYSVVYATITDVQNVQSRSISITLSVTATLTGKFDAMTGPARIRTRPFGVSFTPIHFLPRDGERAIILIEDAGKDEVEISTDYINFFPSGCAIEVVKDLDDPKALQVMENLRKLRRTIANEEEKIGPAKH